MTPLLSIIVPTKSRYATLVPVVKGMLTQIQSRDFEIVVQDNSPDNTGVAELLNLGSDDRLRYFHRAESVSIVANTVSAIENARGRFLSFIGDDDTVAPYIVDEARKLAESGFECLAHAPAYYWWNSVEFAKADHYRRKCAFWLPHVERAGYETLTSREELAHVLANGAVSYYRLPRFYHGIVSRRVLDDIKACTGTYVPGASPDMAFSVAVALVVERYLFASHPVTVFGASRGSGGGRTVERSHHGRLENQPHLPKSTIENWDARLPRYWSEYTIYPQTVQEVYAAFQMEPAPLDYPVLYASIFVNEPWLLRMTWPHVVEACRVSPRAWSRFAGMLLKRALGRGYRSLMSQLGRRPFDLAICSDIEDCMKELGRRYADSHASHERGASLAAN
jgi:glycosyltransferase involved in cell wall biosynthesis